MTWSSEADWIPSGLAYAVVLEDARRDHLRHVGLLMLLRGFDQFLDLSPVGELRQQGLESLRLASGRAEAAVLVNHHCHRKDGQQGKATHHGGSE